MDSSLLGSSIHGISQARILDGLPFPHQEIFLTQRLNSHLWHLLLWQADSLPLSHREAHSINSNWLICLVILQHVNHTLIIRFYVLFVIHSPTVLVSLGNCLNFGLSTQRCWIRNTVWGGERLSKISGWFWYYVRTYCPQELPYSYHKVDNKNHHWAKLQILSL